MRIAFFTDSYTPYVSGVVRSIEAVTRVLVASGHEVSIFAPAYPGHRERKDGVYRFYSVPAPTFRSFYLAIPFSPALLGTLDSLGVEVIHAHSPFLMGRLAANAAQRLELPLVFTYHTRYEEYMHYVPVTPALTRPVTMAWTRRFANQSTCVIAPGASLADDLKRQGIRAPIEVISTGVEVNRVSGGDGPRFRARLGIAPRDAVVLYVGRIAPEKNLDLLAKAFEILAARRPSAHLVLVGSGPGGGQLLTWARAFGGRVHLTGTLEGDDLRDAFAAGDVFAFPSKTETQGLVLAEALVAGLPIVAVEAPATLDVLKEGGGVTVSDDAEAMACSLDRLLTVPGLRRRLLEEARARSVSLSVEASAQHLLAAYGRARARVGRSRRSVAG